MGAARERDAMLVLVLHGRDEVKRWTFLTERWRRSQREENMMAWARGGRGRR